MKSTPEVCWMSIVGARPQFIKLAPVSRAIAEHNQRREPPFIKHIIVHTGQHYDREMSEIFFGGLAIPEPDTNLGVGSGGHGEQLARMLDRLEPVLAEKKPDWVIVYGDTNSTLAGSLMAARLGFALAHVEAGCRSYNLKMPEEQNRVVADHMSQLLLAPSERAVETLRREGVGCSDDPRKRRVAMVGDVMLDALLVGVELAERRAAQKLETLHLKSGQYYLATLHRAENTDDPERLCGILKAFEMLDLPVVLPLHPRTRKVLSHQGLALNSNVRIIGPMAYLDMLALEKHARQILTDSGGVQKEAFYFRVPCVTLRDETEWPETVEAGANQLCGTDSGRILAATRQRGDGLRAERPSPYGDGHAAEKILGELLSEVAWDRL